MQEGDGYSGYSIYRLPPVSGDWVCICGELRRHQRLGSRRCVYSYITESGMPSLRRERARGSERDGGATLKWYLLKIGDRLVRAYKWAWFGDTGAKTSAAYRGDSQIDEGSRLVDTTVLSGFLATHSTGRPACQSGGTR